MAKTYQFECEKIHKKYMNDALNKAKHLSELMYNNSNFNSFDDVDKIMNELKIKGTQLLNEAEIKSKKIISTQKFKNRVFKLIQNNYLDLYNKNKIDNPQFEYALTLTNKLLNL